MTARRRYVLEGVTKNSPEHPELAVTVKRGRTTIGQISVRHVGQPHVTVLSFGLGELPADHRIALELLASRGFLGSWSPSERAPSSARDGQHRRPAG